MTIEKFTGSFSKEDSGCTILVNETVRLITDPEVLGVYCYMLTFANSGGIKFKKIMNHFKINKERLSIILQELIEITLVIEDEIMNDVFIIK